MVRLRHALPLEAWAQTLAGCAEIPEQQLDAYFRDTLLRAGARRLLANHGLEPPPYARLFDLVGDAVRVDAWIEEDAERTRAREAATATLGSFIADRDLPHALGALFEALSSFEVRSEGGEVRLELTRRRKKTGMFYTPSAIAHEVANRALEAFGAVPSSVCDPACGSGAFLIEAARALALKLGDRRAAAARLTGVDLERRALLVAELALWAFVGDPSWDGAGLRLLEGDALSASFDWKQVAGTGFDWVVGNPPWVAFAGRAAQPLAPSKKAHYLAEFVSFRGYPTLHALFVERALSLAPSGVISLLVPSPVADLDGYRAMRRRLLATHEPCEPLLEFGQDAFETVTQPCFALIAKARPDPAPADERRLRLAERELLGKQAKTVAPPEVLLRLARGEVFPRELFGELGFQSNRDVSTRLFLRAESARAPFTYPLLEGREVSEFRVGEPRLFLHPDESLLKKTRCKLRLVEDYRRVGFVVRQTAKYPIAAVHTGLPFRNTLLAGFAVHELAPEFVVGLLNSSLYRALHLASQRDARQKVFPQVKVAHLRALPRPPSGRQALRERVAELTREAARLHIAELRRELDEAVFALFDLASSEREQVLRFVAERAPELAIKY
ncbi:MAG TPA: N-6 DNA methylase [Polyangiaceae bacterium]|nr:N-6 DNA methylase [Polyangiaceae bacterium]